MHNKPFGRKRKLLGKLVVSTVLAFRFKFGGLPVISSRSVNLNYKNQVAHEKINLNHEQKSNSCDHSPNLGTIIKTGTDFISVKNGSNSDSTLSTKNFWW